MFELVYLFGEGSEEYTLNGVTSSEEQEMDLDAVKLVLPQTSTSLVQNDGPVNTTPTGAAVGENVFIIPAAFTAGLPFLGFDIEGVLGGHHGEEEGEEEEEPEQTAEDNLWTGPLVISLTSVNGPDGGEFSVFDSAVPGPNFLMTSADGIDGTDFFEADPDLEVQHHQHFNLTFTEIGTYEIEFTVDGMHEEDGAITGSGTAIFQVVPEPSTYAVIAGAFALGLAVWARKRRAA